MANIEIDCDECGTHKEGTHSKAVKTICIDCYNALIKENKRLGKILIGYIKYKNRIQR